MVESKVTGTANRYGYIVGDSRGDGGESDRPGTVKNCYTDKTVIRSNNVGNITNCETRTAEAFASGEVTYLLNSSTSEGELAWYQTIGTNSHTMFTGKTVYYQYGNYTNTLHTHEWSYSKDEDTITATCVSDGCTLENGNGGSIQIIAPTNLSYDGKEKSATLNGSIVDVETPEIVYEGDRTKAGTVKASITVGEYTVYYKASARNHEDATGSFIVTVDKATVTEPTIASKPYNASAQKADISETELYTVLKNDGGTAKGSYDVVLKLKDTKNYKWATTDSAEVTLQFVISATEDIWTATPTISS